MTRSRQFEGVEKGELLEVSVGESESIQQDRQRDTVGNQKEDVVGSQPYPFGPLVSASSPVSFSCPCQ